MFSLKCLQIIYLLLLLTDWEAGKKQSEAFDCSACQSCNYIYGIPKRRRKTEQGSLSRFCFYSLNFWSFLLFACLSFLLSLCCFVNVRNESSGIGMGLLKRVEGGMAKVRLVREEKATLWLLWQVLRRCHRLLHWTQVRIVKMLLQTKHNCFDNQLWVGIITRSYLGTVVLTHWLRCTSSLSLSSPLSRSPSQSFTQQ